MAAGAGDASGAAKKLLEPPLKTGHSTLDCLDALFADAEEVKFSKDAVVVADGQQQHAVFRVAKGNIRVEKGDSKTTVGQGAVVNRLTAGQLFGEMSFLDSSIPCANCIADSDLELQRLDKASLATKLASNPDLARDFYKHLAISVTQRLSIVSAASAEIPEAPRGAATHLDVAVKGYGMEQLSAAKLLKVRRRLQVGDTVAMTLMMKTTLVNGRSRRQGNLYVFETLVGFVTKAFGIKTHEVFKLSQVHEVLRESFTLKKEEHGIELHMADKHVTFFPVNVEEAYEAIHRCLLQYRAEGSRFSADETTLPSPGGGQRYNNRRGSGLVDANAAFSNNPHGAQALTKSHDARMAEETTTGVFEQLLDQAKCETYKAGDVIIENGTRHCTLFNVASGSVAVQVQRLNEDTQLMEPVKILTLYKGAIFGEMSFLNGDVASATVVAELPCEVYQIKAQDVENMLSDIGKANAAAFYRHLGTYLTHRVRQLTAMVGEALASRVTDIPIEEVLSNGIFFSHFKRFMTEHKLVSPKMLSFLTELNDFLDMPGNLDQAAVAMKLHDKYLVGNPPAIVVPQEALVVVTKALSPTEVPPRDIFGPVLAVALSSLQVNAYRLFSQSSSFQPLLDLKAREEIVPLVSDFKLLQILGEGYEGKVLQARKKDCGVCYALKVLDKTILASRSRRWQMHCSRERECLIACSHPYVVGLAYSFQSPQYLYMVQEYLPNHTLASYLDAHEGHPVAVDHLRFIVAQLACGLAHIHAQDIVYRDLKPANVLVDDGGHMRIVDMGMASKLDPETKRRKSVCGTQRYMAPEMKAKELYNCSVDWYSLGKLILDCQGRSAHAEKVAREWRSSQLDGLVDGLLIKDPTKRLACTAGGVREMQMHPFFKPLDWAVVDMRKMPSPLRREWYIREPDVAASRQFRNGEDIAVVVDKLQAMSVEAEAAQQKLPPNVPNWDYVNPRAVYSEYVSSPYLNYKLPLQF